MWKCNAVRPSCMVCTTLQLICTAQASTINFSMTYTLLDKEVTAIVYYDDDDEDTMTWWKWLIVDARFRRVYRIVTLINLLVLALSIPLPFFDLYNPGDSNKIRTQFAIVTILDLALAVIHTLFFSIKLKKILPLNNNLVSVMVLFNFFTSFFFARTLVIVFLTSQDS